MKIIVKQIDNINSELFNIYDDKNILPAALSIKGLHYQISGFQNNADEYIYYGEYSVRAFEQCIGSGRALWRICAGVWSGMESGCFVYRADDHARVWLYPESVQLCLYHIRHVYPAVSDHAGWESCN